MVMLTIRQTGTADVLDICIRTTFSSAGDVDNSRVLFGAHRPVIKFSVVFIFHDDRRCHNEARPFCFYVTRARIVCYFRELTSSQVPCSVQPSNDKPTCKS